MNFNASSIKHLLEERERFIFEDSSLTGAGVLLPIFLKDETPHILFTKRTDKVEHHKGEISFPGGMKNDDDNNILQTALRETSEEIGVTENNIEILGALDDVPTVTGFNISPFAGVIPFPYELKINREEIERIIEVPLSLLMIEKKWSETFREYKGDMLKTYFFDFNGDVIWGATAGILKGFIEILNGSQGNKKNEKR